MMIFINACYKETSLPKEYMEGFIKLFNPVCPHLGEELWNRLGHNNTISYEPWPKYDIEKTKDDTFEMVVQVNGKVRGKIEVSMETSKEEIEKLAIDIPNVQNFTDGKEIVKIIVVPKKLVNIVVK